MSFLANFRKKFLPNILKSRSPALTEFSAGEVFSLFRRVLFCNNRALEIIADMGEKLSGDFLFDRHYVETVLEDLNEAMHEAIAALSDLTGGGERELHVIFEKLSKRVGTIREMSFNFEGSPMIALDRVRPWNYLEVGAKSANLAEIAGHTELKTPPGFVFTTRIFFDLLKSANLKDDSERLEELIGEADGQEETLEELRAKLTTGILQAEPPPYLLEAVEQALDELRTKTGLSRSLAVRSSALEEDMEYTFAGQFLSIMDVPADAHEVIAAYRRVAVSFYSPKAVSYRRMISPEGNVPGMAVLCQQMVDSGAGGVIYTLDPVKPGTKSMIIVGAAGQGQPVVEGQVPTDFFRLNHERPLRITERLPAGRQNNAEGEAPWYGNEEILLEIGEAGIQLENFFKRPQDIEWAVDGENRLHILQSRPLRIIQDRKNKRPLGDRIKNYEIIAGGRGQIAQLGIAAGPVFLVENLADLENLPDQAVLVSRRDSSQFARVMHRVAAIVTEIGTPISHMATLCREFSIPCLVGFEGIMALLTNGQEITVDAEDRLLYRGRVEELLEFQAESAFNLGDVYEFRLLRKILREVSRLHLVDPLMQNFTAAGCQSYHDILRYIHEKAVLKLVDLGRDDRNLLARHVARPLDLSIPAGIWIIDIGQGLTASDGKGHVKEDDIRSLPFRSLIRGLLTPGVWHHTSSPINFRDIMNSMLNAPEDVISGQYTGHNIAIISESYMNLCFRFGYHFNIIDAYCHEDDRNNHIYFRFLGGATDMTKRSRRAEMIMDILKSYDFNVRVRGDLVIARIHNLVTSEIEQLLEMLGRLVGFTRQLDTRLSDDSTTRYYTQAFLNSDFSIFTED